MSSERAIYLYCLVSPEGFSAVYDQENQPGVDERYPVTALHQNGIVSVIGEVDPAEFSESNLNTLSWLGIRAQRHEAIVEQAMTASTVLPVKFGTLFSCRERLIEFTERHRTSIDQALDTLRGKLEWSVKGFLADRVALPIVVAQDDQIQSGLAALSQSPGARYIQQRQLDAKTEAAMHAWVVRATDDIHRALAMHATASCLLRCHSNSVTGRSARMVFNYSFLLTDTADFIAELTALQHTYRQYGLTLELQGPWPPYNFCPPLAGEEP